MKKQNNWVMNYRFKISCTKENLKAIRGFVDNTLRQLHVDDSQSGLIVLAVDEICANVIIHSNDCNQSNDLEVDIQNEQDSIVINIKDKGDCGDPETFKDYSLTELTQMRRKGGLGLKLVNKIVDKIDYHFDDPYNICTLYKKVNMSLAV